MSEFLKKDFKAKKSFIVPQLVRKISDNKHQNVFKVWNTL